MLIGNAFIRLITKEADKNAIIKNAKKIIPNDLRLDLKPKTCLVDMINDANIQNWVKNMTGKTKSGVTAKNLINPGACA